MDFDWSEWGPPLGVLIMGLGFGGLFAARARRTANEAATVEEKGRRTDLEERKRSVVEALRALELEKDKMAPEDYARERASLLASGADALRGLDQPSPAAGAPPSAAGRPRTAADLPEAARKLSLETLAALEKDRERLGEAALAEAVGAWVGESPAAPAGSAEPTAIAPEWKGALYALCVVGLIGVLWVTLGNQATDRGAGGSITGNAQSDGPTAEEQAQHDAEKKELEARVEKDPKDLEALNKLTVIALSDQDVQGAMQRNEAALAVDPKDAEARVYRAVLAGMMGMTDRSLQMLDDVLTDQPDFPMALVYKGLIAIEAGKPDVAIPALEKAIQVGAANPEFLQQELAKAKQMQAGGGAGPMAGGPMAGPAAGGPMDGGGGPAEPVVSGTITLDPSAQPRAGSAQVLFVSVKDPAGGPPLAAKKLPPGPFPMDFTITTADELPMAGGRPFPDKVNVSVRLDDDGNAFTHGEGEPQWTTEGVSKGTSGLAAVLQ